MRVSKYCHPGIYDHLIVTYISPPKKHRQNDCDRFVSTSCSPQQQHPVASSRLSWLSFRYLPCSRLVVSATLLTYVFLTPSSAPNTAVSYNLVVVLLLYIQFNAVAVSLCHSNERFASCYVNAIGPSNCLLVASMQGARIHAFLPVFVRSGSAVFLRGSTDCGVRHDGKHSSKKERFRSSLQ